jgi:3-methyl-2-oxobutanoate hydroxymethyltransferase
MTQSEDSFRSYCCDVTSSTCQPSKEGGGDKPMRVTINTIKDMKASGEKIAMITAYDYSFAKLVDETGVPLVLVGDSLGNVALGYESTIPVTMDDMIHHTKAVVRGTKQALVIGDMPFMTYHISVEQALSNAARFIQEGGAQAIKLEGGHVVADKVKRIVDCGIPVMGHIGLTPQSINQLGGYKAQGKTPESAQKLLQDAFALETAGAFAIVLESVPYALAKIITKKLAIPTIGIGAGPHCDGQVQVIHDMLGLFTDFVPKHVKQSAKLSQNIKDAVSQYMKEVKDGSFPTYENSYKIDESILNGLA